MKEELSGPHQQFLHSHHQNLHHYYKLMQVGPGSGHLGFVFTLYLIHFGERKNLDFVFFSPQREGLTQALFKLWQQIHLPEKIPEAKHPIPAEHT